MVSFKDNNIGQPPVNLCIITLNGVNTPCQIDETYTFPITDGVIDYTYTIVVGNVVGSLSKTGVVRDLMVPTSVLIPTTAIVTQTMTVTVTSGYSGNLYVHAIGIMIITGIVDTINRKMLMHHCG
ncbi:PREDICTED: uncharacterized protein LOC109590457 [Amphimedon queenslandica]|uniref:Uncharacterized protein n=1 Tax=Amphimedon queenslandica TaxID=400682 RepID=A0A1X7T0G6_AMPQE|nr:PREDICTED: uncharacterized protein LOC109590457 [Amphimedon queenslandica]|eukprot:XP_019861934.1 PREDICTED: uncharacterized protein LOC109590457 [Amphimedon queenslandica]